jgi:hypothetical protein
LVEEISNLVSGYRIVKDCEGLLKGRRADRDADIFGGSSRVDLEDGMREARCTYCGNPDPLGRGD